MGGMRRLHLDQTITIGLAAYALGRLVSVDTVARPVMNQVLRAAVYVDPPNDLFTGNPHEDDLNAAVVAQLDEDAARDELDLRALWNAGWAKERSTAGKWAAEMLTCPTCSSFHMTYLVRIALGDWKAWTPAWWVRQFASWAVAQTAVRLPFNAGGLKTENDYVTQAFERTSITK